MALDVIVASTDRDLTTCSDLRSMALGYTATSTAAALMTHLSAMVRRASAHAESYIGQPLTVQTYRETVAGYGRRRLMLSRTPIRAIKAIYRGTDTGSDTVLETSQFIVEDREAGFIARDAGFSWNAALQWRGNGIGGGDAIPLDPQPMPGQEYRPWLVDYVAGYTHGGVDTGSNNWSTVAGTTSTERTLPEDIEYGVLLRAQALYENNDGINSESLGDLSVSYGSTSGKTQPWQEALGPWRRIV